MLITTQDHHGDRVVQLRVQSRKYRATHVSEMTTNHLISQLPKRLVYKYASDNYQCETYE